MAIQLQIYLKRTQQTLEQWVDANGITKASDVLPRCAYIGLAATNVDVGLVEQLLRGRAEAKTTSTVAHPPAEERSRSKKKRAPLVDKIGENVEPEDFE